MSRYRLTEDQIAAMSPQIAEMELGAESLTVDQMASALGTTAHKLTGVRNSEHYKGLLARLIKRREHEAERAAVDSTVQTRKKLNLYSTEAIEKLVMLMRGSKDDRVKLSAACEIIDRDGRFSKVSRLMNVRAGEDGSPMLPEDISAEILEALKGTKGPVM